ncbi:MAG: hypothetical protein ACYTBV_02295 [Planctomycetota bacterium]|jgi:hypothetical protein
MGNRQFPKLPTWIFYLLVVIIISPNIAMALTIGEAVEEVADRLEAEQTKFGVSAGIWPEEADFTGSIVAGMVSAYELKCDSAYRDSAELGGDYILYAAGGNFYGDEAFALTRLSDISADPCDNDWRTDVNDFYFNVAHDTNGTVGYIAQFQGTEPSTAVFYLANHVVAANYVNAEDMQIWRDALIDWLAKVDDGISNHPVLALGIATWALAQTGPMDGTLVDQSGTGEPYWNLVTLADLPVKLLGHQVPDGEAYSGSFYWRFDHTNGGSPSEIAGHTEDTIFGTLGLLAASHDPGSGPILAAHQILLDGVGGEGTVWEHLSQDGAVFYTYAGEMLQVLGELVISGDGNLDGCVNFIDWANFANNWMDSGCMACCWCNKADLDQSGEVNYIDSDIFFGNWLKGICN